MMAKLYFRYGAMNSGKTTNLLQVAYNYKERGMNPFIIKPFIDTKGGDKITSRLGVDKKVDKTIKKNDNVYDIIQNILNDARKKNISVDCILVDEVQFFTKNQIDSFLKIVVELDIPVICYGLRTDFLMNGFEGAERLLLLAHSIEELKTICRCGNKATLNGRKIDGRYVFEGEQVAIDNSSSIEYESLCPSCYFKYKKMKI